MQLQANNRKSFILELDQTQFVDKYTKDVGLSVLALFPQIQTSLNLLSTAASFKHAKTSDNYIQAICQLSNLGGAYFFPTASLIAGSVFRIFESPTHLGAVASEIVYIGANLYGGHYILIASLAFQGLKELSTAYSKLNTETQGFTQFSSANKEIVCAAIMQIALGTLRGYTAYRMVMPMLSSPIKTCDPAHLENPNAEATILVDGFETAKLSDKQLELVNAHIKDKYQAELTACDAHQGNYISSGTIHLIEKNQELSFNSNVTANRKYLGDDYYQDWVHQSSSLQLKTKNQPLTKNLSTELSQNSGKYTVQITPTSAPMRGDVVETWKTMAPQQLTRTYDGFGGTGPRPEDILQERMPHMEELLYQGIYQLLNGNTTEADRAFSESFEKVSTIIDSVPRLDAVKSLLGQFVQPQKPYDPEEVLRYYLS